MLALSRDKSDKKTAIELFKLVQIYMGDRKARVGMSLNSVAIDIIVAALPQQQWVHHISYINTYVYKNYFNKK